MVPRVLLIGAGITSAIASSYIRKELLKDVTIIVWEKARGFGGRMSTIRSPNDSNCIADLGAQYITLSEENISHHNEIYRSLLDAKLLEPLCSNIQGMKDMPKGTRHFIAPYGMNSLIKHFFNNVVDDTCFEHHVSAINLQGDKWEVQTKSGLKDIFDIVVLTMPVPQILQLKGTIEEVINKNQDIADNLKSVKYSSRYALALFFKATDKFKTDWDSKYIYDNDIFRYVTLDNKKRNRPDLPPAAVFHTSVQYGLENLNEKLEDIETELFCHVREMFPDWPEPAHIKCHRWRFSQVLTPYKEQPGYIKIAENPLLIAGGDSFTSSHIDDCISSALIFSDEIIRVVRNPIINN